MKPMKTPGVYIVEKNAFPNSVVQVATAVPAFIGYTERAINGNRTLRNTPWRISSMAEFHDYFGYGPSPLFDLVKREAPAADEPSELSAEGTAKTDPLPEASLTVMGAGGRGDLGPGPAGQRLRALWRDAAVLPERRRHLLHRLHRLLRRRHRRRRDAERHPDAGQGNRAHHPRRPRDHPADAAPTP